MPNFGGGFTDNDAIRELRDELKDLNKNLKSEAKVSVHLTRANFVLAFAMFFLALMQLVQQIFGSPEEKLGKWAIFIFVILSLFGFVSYLSSRIYKSKGNSYSA